MHPFERSGFAALSDLKTKEWKNIYNILEEDQNEFLKYEKGFRSPEYKWPRDPLHTWSRIWEYSYVYYHLKVQRDKYRKNYKPVVVDFGSGVTFFPFSVAKLNYSVMCIDNDPICGKDINKAIKIINSNTDCINFSPFKNNNICLNDKVADIIYSISVFEHIFDFKTIAAEINRILKTRGLLFLTIDIDLRGDSEMGIEKFNIFKKELVKYFDFFYNEIIIHPLDLLTSDSEPYGFKKLKGLKLIQFLLKQQIIKPLLGLKPIRTSPFHLTILSMAMIKKQ